MAVNLGIANLDDIKPFKTSWKIQVKIVNLWTQYTQYTGETMEMILADITVSIYFILTRSYTNYNLIIIIKVIQLLTQVYLFSVQDTLIHATIK